MLGGKEAAGHSKEQGRGLRPKMESWSVKQPCSHIGATLLVGFLLHFLLTPVCHSIVGQRTLHHSSLMQPAFWANRARESVPKA